MKDPISRDIKIDKEMRIDRTEIFKGQIIKKEDFNKMMEKVISENKKVFKEIDQIIKNLIKGEREKIIIKDQTDIKANQIGKKENNKVLKMFKKKMILII